MATALDYAHRQGLLHRDVKPENILFSGDEPCLADFGIARALDDAGWTTTTGIVRGTPAYMSPEQASGESTYDGRSDIYSLGCVLYEMLAGVMPFHGATPQAVLAQRFTHAPESLGRYRATVPAGLERVVMQALAPAPADRWGNGAGHSRMRSRRRGSLHSTGGWSGGGTVGPPPDVGPPRLRATRRRRPYAVAGVAAAAALAVGLWTSGAASRGSPGGGDSVSADGTPDAGAAPLRVHVAPATRVTDSDVPVAARFSEAIRAELAGWTGVEVTDTPGDAALSIVPSVAALGDSVHVSLALRAQRGGERRVLRRVSAGEVTTPAVVAGLVRDALAGADGAKADGLERMPGRSLAALRAYVSGWQALRDGRFESAAARLRLASRLDPAFAQASLWAAQSGAWADPKLVRAWRADAAAAYQRAGLSVGESWHAAALRAMSENRYPEACDAFRSMTRVAPTAFAAWFGLGECARLDSTVIRTPRGPAFRGSYWSALAAYREAVDNATESRLLGALFQRIAETCNATGGRARNGWVADGARMPYAALPSLDHDSVAYVPLPYATFVAGGQGAVPASYDAAVRLGRTVALELTERWVRRSPESGVAWLQHALALERTGQLAPGTPERSAPAALDRAAMRLNDLPSLAHLGVARTRFALRLGDYGGAKAAAARTIALVSDSAGPDVSASVAPLAALIDDTAAVKRLLSVGGSDPALPMTLATRTRDFAVVSALGHCDALAARRAALDTAFGVAFAKNDLRALRERHLHPLYRGAVPCLGPGIVGEFAPTLPIDTAFTLLDRGDPRGAADVVLRLQARRAGAASAAVSWDQLFLESWTLVQSGDTASARRLLIDAYDDPALLNPLTLDWVELAAGFRRGLSLLSQIDRAPAATGARGRWAHRVAQLST